jgi:arabinose-5-phosphate isomerase
MVPVAGAVRPDTTMRDVVMSLAHARGLATVVEDDRVTGVITAGDLSRIAERWDNFLDLPAADVMTSTPRTAKADDLASTVTGHMERIGIVAMPVVDENRRMVGVVHLHDLMRAGAV